MLIKIVCDLIFCIAVVLVAYLILGIVVWNYTEIEVAMKISKDLIYQDEAGFENLIALDPQVKFLYDSLLDWHKEFPWTD